MPSRLRDRLRRVLARVAAYRPGAKVRSRLLAAALVLFLALTAISVANLPPVSLTAGWIGALVVLVAVTVALNAFEFHLVGRLSGITVRVRRALEITVWSRAANMLPFPGGSVVRAHDLASDGGGWSDPTRALVATGVASLAVSSAAAGTAVFLTGRAYLGGGFLAFALAATTGVVLVLPPGGGRRGWTIGLLALRAAFVVVGGLRFYVIARAIGLRVPLVVALAFALASSIGSAVGVFPDGLGVRELVAGGLAPLVGVEPSVGVMVTALDRVASLALVGAVSGVLALQSRWERGRAAPRLLTDGSAGSSEDPGVPDGSPGSRDDG